MCYSRELLTPFNPNSLQSAATQWSDQCVTQQGHQGPLLPVGLHPFLPYTCLGWQGDGPVSPGVPSGRTVAPLYVVRPSRATCVCPPPHVTERGWWICVQGSHPTLEKPLGPMTKTSRDSWLPLHCCQLEGMLMATSTAVLSPPSTHQDPSSSLLIWRLFLNLQARSGHLGSTCSSGVLYQNAPHSFSSNRSSLSSMQPTHVHTPITCLCPGKSACRFMRRCHHCPCDPGKNKGTEKWHQGHAFIWSHLSS